MTCKFNVIGFGDRFDKLFASSVNYSEANLNTAVQKIPGECSVTLHSRYMELQLNMQRVKRLQVFTCGDGF